MTAPLPTPDEVAGVRERHVARTYRKSVPVFDEFDSPWQTVTECSCGSTSWPCDAARLLALVDSQALRMQHLENVFAQQDDRLAAVLAVAEEVEQANGYGQRIGYTLSREQHSHDLDRIRRAANGGTP